jgi:hypothetical protein
MKDIKGFEGQYAVTSCGKIWSYKRHKFIALSTTSGGYVEAILFTGDKNHKKHLQVHKLVIEAYKPNTSGQKLECDHIDENKQNNSINNLQWVTHKENCNRGTRNIKISKSMIGNNRGKRRVV